MCLSVPQMAAAATRITTSPAAGLGRGQSRISVPWRPSAALVFTTACIMRNVGRALARRAGGRAKARPTFVRKVSQRLLRRMSPDEPSQTAERGVDGMVDRARRRLDDVRADGQAFSEAIDLPNERVGIAHPEVFVQAPLDDEQLFSLGRTG